MKTSRPAPDAVVSITSAREAHSDEFDRRMKRYLISMVIRTVCFILLVVVPGPWRWFFALGAIVLPYVAVIIANTGYHRMTIDPGIGAERSPATQAAAGEPVTKHLPPA